MAAWPDVKCLMKAYAILTSSFKKKKQFLQECLFFLARDRGKTAILFLAVFPGIEMCMSNADILEVALIECIPWSHYTKKETAAVAG